LIYQFIYIKFTQQLFLTSSEFFKKSIDNSIKFWDCPSHCNWSLHLIVDKKTKKFDLILNVWKMRFQAPDDKGQYFLKLCNDNIQSIILSIAKGGLWLKYFGHSNLLCIKVSRAIVNHVPIGKYWLRFFSREKFDCPYGSYPIELRWHILYKCKEYNNYWNPRWDSIVYFILFLKFNSGDFSFGDGIM